MNIYKKSGHFATSGFFFISDILHFCVWWSRTLPFWRCVGKVGHTEEGVSVCNAFSWILNQIYLSIYCQPPFHFVFVAKFRGWNWKIGQYRRGGKVRSKVGETYIQTPRRAFSKCPQIAWTRANKLPPSQIWPTNWFHYNL